MHISNMLLACHSVLYKSHSHVTDMPHVSLATQDRDVSKKKANSNADSLRFAHLFSIMLFSYMKVLQLFITKHLYCLEYY